MPTKVYDVAVIGAGINGATAAYEFHKSNKSVVVFDKDGIAKGGSGAAGAFISPKFSKQGELKELIEDAFLYSMQFYTNYFPQHFMQKKLLHIAKDEDDAKMLRHYKNQTTLKLLTPSKETLQRLNLDIQSKEMVSLKSGLVDAQSMCKALLENICYKTEEIDTLECKDGVWILNNKYKAQSVILSTGAYNSLIDEPYIGIRGIWGHRVDLKGVEPLDSALHQFVSIASLPNELCAVGATHNVHYHPQRTPLPYNIQEGRDELLQKMRKTLQVDDIEIVQDYVGLRSGSTDYMPLVGKVVDSQKTVQKLKRRLERKDVAFDEFVYFENLFMINGNGGYGFVLAPYLAKMLRELVLEKKEITKQIAPARFFARWARKGKNR